MSDLPEIEVTDERTGEAVDMSVLEDTDTAFDPSKMHLDLTREEKRRTTALMLAMQGYRELIIKEADYLVAAADLARRNEGPALSSATIDGMVDAAMKFDMFITSGRMLAAQDPPAGRPTQPNESATPPVDK